MGGLDLSWLDFVFLGHPDIQSKGAQNRKIQPRWIQPPLIGPLRFGIAANLGRSVLWYSPFRGTCPVSQTSHLGFPEVVLILVPNNALEKLVLETCLASSCHWGQDSTGVWTPKTLRNDQPPRSVPDE